MAADALAGPNGSSEQSREGQDWLRVGCKALLKGLSKFPQLNGQQVEVLSWNAEKQRWKCLLPKGGDVNVFTANLEPSEMDPVEIERIDGFLRDGQLFEAWNGLHGRAAAPPQLKAALDKLLAPGTYSEIVEGRLELVRIDDNGMGYRAAKNIKKGTVLLFDTALASLQIPTREGREMGLNLVSSDDDPWRKMARMISQEVKDETFISQKILSLNVGRLDEGKPPLQSILENTTLECTREPGRMAFFAAAARFNHSCCPAAYADSSRSVCVVRALRDIAAREEVCISYVPVSDSRKRRQEKLKMYGFDCKCERCQAEEVADPQVMVPANCGALSFTIEEDRRLYQACEKCGDTFNREEACHRLSKVTEANRKHAEAMRNSGDPWAELKRLTSFESYFKKGEKDGLPPSHTEGIVLMNNIAHLHYHLATREKGDHCEQSLEAFHRYKKLAIEMFEEKHSTWTNQRDVDYFQVLHQFLKAVGHSEQGKQLHAQKLKEACLVHFGQTDLPETLMSN